MKGIDGKSIIVTGAGSGIGEAIAFLLAEAGGKLIIGDINAEKGEAVTSAIRKKGGEAQFVSANVALEEDAKALVNAARNAYGRLDRACNAAGVPQSGKALHEVSLSDWDRCHAVNLRGLFLCNKYQIQTMLETGGGAIVNIVSTAAMVGFPNGSEYCASKAGAMGMVRGAALDYATRGVRINAVLPGGTRTPMMEGAIANDPGLEPALAAVHPMNRFAQPNEIAGAARWLLSDEATFVTGAAFAVDGGHTAI